MEPPSTPAPVAMRGPREVPSSIRDPRAAFAEVERLTREALEDVEAPPMTMRGDALDRVLEGVRSTPRSSKLRPITNH